MTIQKMHWRGLTMTGLAEAAKGAGDRAGKAIDAALEFVAASTERIAAMESGAVAGRDRPTLESLLAQCDPNAQRTDEEQVWLDMAPVGREFGSPDYERLMEEDARTIQVNLTRLVSKCRGLYDSQKDPLDRKMRRGAVNVQAALKELGFDVTVEDAAAVWIRHSKSLCAGWMAGAEDVTHAKWTLISFCRLGTDDFSTCAGIKSRARSSHGEPASDQRKQRAAKRGDVGGAAYFGNCLHFQFRAFHAQVP